MSISRPTSGQSSSEEVRFYYDGDARSVSSRDIAIAFAVSQGVTEPTDIILFANQVLAVSLSSEDVTTSIVAPLSISEFDGDGVTGQICDAAILFAIGDLTSDGSAVEEIAVESFLRTNLGFEGDCLIEDSFPLPGPRTPLPGVNRIYGHDLSKNLYLLDVNTLQANLIGNTDVVLFDIAADSNGDLFGISSGGVLYSLDPETAASSPIGSLGVGSSLNALVFDDMDVLWGAGLNSLVIVDPATGQGELFSDLDGFNSSGDLTLDKDGRLLLTTVESRLLSIDRNTGSVSTFGVLPANDFFAMDRSEDGRIIATTSDNRVFLVNEMNGVLTFLGNITADFPIGETGGGSSIP